MITQQSAGQTPSGHAIEPYVSELSLLILSIIVNKSIVATNLLRTKHVGKQISCLWQWITLLCKVKPGPERRRTRSATERTLIRRPTRARDL